MDHFEFKVGSATVHVHQAFMLGETAHIIIESGGERKILDVDMQGAIQPVEIKLVD